MLWLYPADFRRRFGIEMLELAEAVEPREWTLIFGDTSVDILRSWLRSTEASVWWERSRLVTKRSENGRFRP